VTASYVSCESGARPGQKVDSLIQVGYDQLGAATWGAAGRTIFCLAQRLEGEDPTDARITRLRNVGSRLITACHVVVSVYRGRRLTRRGNAFRLPSSWRRSWSKLQSKKRLLRLISGTTPWVWRSGLGCGVGRTSCRDLRSQSGVDKPKSRIAGEQAASCSIVMHAKPGEM